MPALIHSLLAVGAYRITEESGAVRDPEALFVTKRQKIIYRGTENALINDFAIGGSLTLNQASHGGGSASAQSRMLCGGPQNIRLVPGTALDPHWEADLEWVGIHSSYYGSTETFIWRAEDEFTRVETEFPKKAIPTAGGAETVFAVGTPFITGAAANPYTSSPKKCRIITFVPSKKIVGVIKGAASLAAIHATIKARVIGTLGTPEQSLFRKWWKEGTAPPVPATYCPDPLWTWAVNYMENVTSDDANAGAWVPATLQVRRHLSVGDLFAFTLDIPWEQRVTPG